MSCTEGCYSSAVLDSVLLLRRRVVVASVAQMCSGMYGLVVFHSRHVCL